MHFLAHGVCTVDQVCGEMASCLRICKSTVIWAILAEIAFLSLTSSMPQFALDRPGAQKTLSPSTKRVNV